MEGIFLMENKKANQDNKITWKARNTVNIPIWLDSNSSVYNQRNI